MIGFMVNMSANSYGYDVILARFWVSEGLLYPQNCNYFQSYFNAGKPGFSAVVTVSFCLHRSTAGCRASSLHFINYPRIFASIWRRDCRSGGASLPMLRMTRVCSIVVRMGLAKDGLSSPAVCQSAIEKEAKSSWECGWLAGW